MKEMTSRERIHNILHRKKVDRIGVFEAFWGDTRQKWVTEGHMKEDEKLNDHFDLDLRYLAPFKMVADFEFTEQILEEDEETQTYLNGNGATLRRHKLHSSTPEHIDFSVKDREAWESLIKPKLLARQRERINFEAYRTAKANSAAKEKFFALAAVNVFEMMHPVCGHEYMLMGMALDPDWIKDMVKVYSELNIQLMEILFAECGKPDGIWYWEDMGFKSRPFMSPQMYREIIQDGHKKTIDFCHSHGLKVVMHSCGFVEPLLPGMVEAGIDCLQAIEVKAGMDVLRIKKNFGDQIALCGGMDVRKLVANDLNAVKAELKEKIPALMDNYGYILHSDHSIPTDCKYETYRYFIEEGLKLGTY